jgi:hypothetical protein
MHLTLVLASLLATAVPAAAQQLDGFDWTRARDNYAALVEGRKQFHHLTPLEQREFLEFRRVVNEALIDPRSLRDRCVDEQRERLRTKRMTELDRRHIDMVCRDERD